MLWDGHHVVGRSHHMLWDGLPTVPHSTTEGLPTASIRPIESFHGTLPHPARGGRLLRDLLRGGMAPGVYHRGHAQHRHGEPNVLPPAKASAGQRLCDHADAHA